MAFLYLSGRTPGREKALDWDAEDRRQAESRFQGWPLPVLDSRNRSDRKVGLYAKLPLAPAALFPQLADRVRGSILGHGGVVPAAYKPVNTPRVQLTAMAGRRPANAAEVLARLREERERRKAANEPYGTLKEIAAELDVSFGLVGHWETEPGKSGHQYPTEVRRWVKLLDLPQEWADLYDVYRTADRMVEQIEAGQLRGRFSEADRRLTWEHTVRTLLGGLRR